MMNQTLIKFRWLTTVSFVSPASRVNSVMFPRVGFFHLLRGRIFGQYIQESPESLWNPRNIRVRNIFSGNIFIAIRRKNCRFRGGRYFICTLFSGKCDIVAVESLNGAECNLFAYMCADRGKYFWFSSRVYPRISPPPAYFVCIKVELELINPLRATVSHKRKKTTFLIPQRVISLFLERRQGRRLSKTRMILRVFRAR